MSYIQGLETGRNVARSAIEAYQTSDTRKRERKAAEEIAALNAQYRATSDPMSQPAQPTGLQPGEVSRVNAAGPATITGITRRPIGSAVQTPVAAAPTAPVAPIQGPTLGAPGGVPTQPVAQAAQPATRMSEADFLDRQADIYAQYGLVADADRLRSSALEARRYESATATEQARYEQGLVRESARDERQQAQWEAEFGQRGQELKARADQWAKEYELRAEEAGAAEEQIGNARAFGTALSSAIAAGEQPSLEKILQLGAQSNIDPMAAVEFAAKMYDVDEIETTREATKLSTDLTRAAAKGVDGVNEFLRSSAAVDPDTTDDISPQLQELVPGVWAMMYGDKALPGTQLFTDMDGAPGWQQYIESTLGILEGNPLAWGVQKAAMKGESRMEFTGANAAAVFNSLVDPTNPNQPRHSDGSRMTPLEIAQYVNAQLLPALAGEAGVEAAGPALVGWGERFEQPQPAAAEQPAEQAQMQARLQAMQLYDQETANLAQYESRMAAALEELARLSANGPATNTPRGSALIAEIRQLTAMINDAGDKIASARATMELSSGRRGLE